MRTEAIRSSLVEAIKNGNVRKIRRLLKYAGADPNQVLHWAAFHGRADIVTQLVVDVHHDGDQVLRWAVLYGPPGMAQVLLCCKADTVAAAQQAPAEERAAVLRGLNSLVGNIPRDQWQALLSLYEGDLPALVAAEAAAQRLVNRSRRPWSPPPA